MGTMSVAKENQRYYNLDDIYGDFYAGGFTVEDCIYSLLGNYEENVKLYLIDANAIQIRNILTNLVLDYAINNDMDNVLNTLSTINQYDGIENIDDADKDKYVLYIFTESVFRMFLISNVR